MKYTRGKKKDKKKNPRTQEQKNSALTQERRRNIKKRKGKKKIGWKGQKKAENLCSSQPRDSTNLWHLHKSGFGHKGNLHSGIRQTEKKKLLRVLKRKKEFEIEFVKMTPCVCHEFVLKQSNTVCNTCLTRSICLNCNSQVSTLVSQVTDFKSKDLRPRENFFDDQMFKLTYTLSSSKLFSNPKNKTRFFLDFHTHTC